MVFFKGLYRTIILFVFFAFFFVVMSLVFGMNFWPSYRNSIESMVILFIFALCVALSATY